MRVVIDGNIGGKTHLIRRLKSKFSMIRVIEENVDEWEPYQRAFMKICKSLLFQMKVLEHHLRQNKQKMINFVYNRPLSCINVFWRFAK